MMTMFYYQLLHTSITILWRQKYWWLTWGYHRLSQSASHAAGRLFWLLMRKFTHDHTSCERLIPFFIRVAVCQEWVGGWDGEIAWVGGREGGRGGAVQEEHSCCAQSGTCISATSTNTSPLHWLYNQCWTIQSTQYCTYSIHSVT